MKSIFNCNCTNEYVLLWRALKTMPFGILLAWAYISFWMLALYFTWRSLQQAGWPMASWEWVRLLAKVSFKWVLVMGLLWFLLTLFQHAALYLPTRDRLSWRCEDLLIESESLREPFSAWKWAKQESYIGSPRSNWEAKRFCSASLVRPQDVERRRSEEPVGTFVNVFIMEAQNYQAPVGVWSELGEYYWKKVVEEAWAQAFASEYACAWNLVRTQDGDIVYYGVYDEFVLVILFVGDATHPTKAIQSFIQAQDAKLGAWVEDTRVEHFCSSER